MGVVITQARGLRDPYVAAGGFGPGGDARLRHRPPQPVDLWPAAGLLRPTIPLVPAAQTVVLPCMCPSVPSLPLPCFRAGLDAGMLLPAPAMPTGTYEWVILKRKRCALPLPLNWCAEALNALPKANLCF